LGSLVCQHRIIMSEDYGKVLFTATDPGGCDLWLVRLIDGRWGILADGECVAVGWPEGALYQATLAYREMIAGTNHQDSK
jgi:hypothetical protein